MRILVVLALLAGCDDLDHIDLPADASPQGDGDGGGAVDDGGSLLVDAAPTDDAISLTFAVGFVCAGKTVAGNLYLARDPLGSVTVTVTSSDPSHLTIGPPTTFVFDSSNWNGNRQVFANGIAPTIPAITITASAPSFTPKTDTLFVRAASATECQ